jgi:serine/threonine protein kinase
MEKGEIKWRDRNNQPIFKVDQIRPMMRDVVLGLEYIHFQGIIHRDIKPGNLLISNTGTVKISDFGVSHLAKMDEAGNLLPENDLDLAKTAGSPAFFAPELCQFESDKPRPVITKAIDVWALGITFYCLLFGREPFPGVYGEMELYEKICKIEIEPPEDQVHRIDADTKDLLRRFLTKNPEERIRLPQVRRHPFITKDIPDPKRWAEETDLTKTSTPLEVTPQEVERAVTSFRNIVRRTLAQVKMTAKRSMSYLRPRHATGRVISGIQPPATASIAPNSSGIHLNVDTPLQSRSPKSDITDFRPKVHHAYFDPIIKTMDVTPPTPPDSGRVGTVVPNGHVNGHHHRHHQHHHHHHHHHHHGRHGSHHNTEDDDRRKSVTPPSPFTPTSIRRMSMHHLNDDYSNLYYSDDGLEEEDFDHDSDDGGDDRLEIKFGSKKGNK